MARPKKLEADRSQTLTVSLHPALAERLRAECPGDGPLSGHVAWVLGAYYQLADRGLAKARRALTRAEAALILEVQNGVALDPISIWLSGGLAHQVEDGLALGGLENTAGVDGPALVRKLEALDELAVFGVLVWARTFWGGGGQDTEASLAGFQ